MQPLYIDQITDLLKLVGMDDGRHPLFHILKVETINQLPVRFPVDFSFGFYSIGLIRNMKGEVRCGRRSYDFDKGTMFFLAPNQLAGHTLEALADADGWLVFFHKAYLSNHHLERSITNYGFFEYVINEALHLSKNEEESLEQLFLNMFKEYQSSIDQFSKTVVVSNLELMLTYANRYYDRQFITRNDVESTFLTKFEKLLNDYFRKEGKDTAVTVPTVNMLADQLNMSAKYLGDKIRTLTGKTAQEHINLKIVEQAKVYLMQKDYTVSEIAHHLGFEYPAYFSRFFKKKVGISPKVFQSMN